MSFKILLAFHTSSTQFAHNISDYLSTNKNMSIYLVDEKNPDKLSVRADFVKKSNAVFVILDRAFQKSLACMEIVHFAKDIKKKLYSFNINQSYVPFGALGAIISGTESGVIELYDKNSIPDTMDKIIASFNIQNIQHNENNNVIDTSRIATPSVNINFEDKEQVNVLISYHSESKNTVDLISSELKKRSILYLCEESTTGSTCVKNCKVILLIMSQGYEENYCAKAIIEKAREMDKKIVPISTTRAWKPSGWLALFLAGKLFYRIMDKEQAYKKKHEWHYCQMDSLIDEIIIATTVTKPTEDEIEQKLIKSLNSRIEDCKKKVILKFYQFKVPKMQNIPPLE
jgi:hypothetical protein